MKMNITAPLEYRKKARRKLPQFLFDYIDGGANAEQTLRANELDLQNIELKQRVLKKIEQPSLTTNILGHQYDLPIVLAPVGITGMYARRGEVQAAKAAVNQGIAYSLSTVSVCSIAEVVADAYQGKQINASLWFQLYVLKDRGFMKHVLTRAWEQGIRNLVFTVDMPVPGIRYRDAHSGMSGPFAKSRQLLQAMIKPSWAINVGLLGRPHGLGNISDYLGKKVSLADYKGWLDKNFDPSIGWQDLAWLRDFWQGKIIIKGILEVEDAKAAVQFGADGIVVSNHGGRQLDGVMSSAKALPDIADAVGDRLTILADSGIRSGIDIVRMLTLGADAVMLGRSYIYALAVSGQKGVEHLINSLTQEMKVAMTLTGVRRFQT